LSNSPKKIIWLSKNMYQTILYKYRFNEDINNPYRSIFSKLDDTGSLFIFFETEYDSDGFVKNSVFDVVDLFLNLKFVYKNIIIYPIKIDNNWGILKRNVGYILWFVKNDNMMFFNKDVIREKHIWKDVEWGKRKKNYNPKGKDPGNVWMPTIDNGKGLITEHLILSIEDIINRCISSTFINYGKVFVKLPNIDKAKIVNIKNITFEKDNTDKRLKYNDFVNKSDANIKKIITSSDIYFSSSEKMVEIKDKIVDIMITSPPYWDLKNYFKKGQIGHESYDKYLKRMNSVWKETFRVLKDSGSMWININMRIKNKKPILIPGDIIKQCKKIGFRLKDIILWHKSSGIPTHKDNVVNRYEYFLWFSKSDIFKLNNINFKDYKNKYINNGLIWNVNRKAGSVGKNYIHPAIYPVKLIDRIINLCSDEGDIVLDPFLGSGTTIISALNNNRNSIGYEFSEEFAELIKYRIKEETKLQEYDIKYHISNFDKKNKIFRTKIKFFDLKNTSNPLFLRKNKD